MNVVFPSVSTPSTKTTMPPHNIMYPQSTMPLQNTMPLENTVHLQSTVRHNPFATRFTSPGRIPPLDADGEELAVEPLLRRLAQCGNIAAIRGPHGSGKSTLLMAMADLLRRQARLGGHVRLGQGRCRDRWAVLRGLASCRRGQVLCIDSWERLDASDAAITVFLARTMGRGLLTTAHHHGPLPTLVSCRTSPRLLSRIVDRLPDPRGLVDDTDIDRAFHSAGGDLRESLFLLYDRFERASARTVRW